MKLYYSKTSPYSRKVLVILMEHGLFESAELVLVDPFGEAAELKAQNPLGKIPTLVDGELVLYDSPVICEYIDAKSASPWLAALKKDSSALSKRFSELRRAALADGLIDSALAIVLEKRRPSTERSPAWMEKQQASIERTLPVMERELSAFGESCSYAQVAFGCALGYLDFRLDELDWRSPCPLLAEWYEEFKKRPSMQATQPRGLVGTPFLDRKSPFM